MLSVGEDRKSSAHFPPSGLELGFGKLESKVKGNKGTGGR